MSDVLVMKRGRPSATRRTVAIWVLRTAFVLLLVGGWIFATTAGDVAPFVLPPLDAVLVQFWQNLTLPELWVATGTTVLEMAAGFLLAAVLGLWAGFVLSRRPLRAAVWEPLLAWGYIFPISLMYPLFIIWSGVGVESKILFAAASAVFPIAYNTMKGLNAVDPRYLKVGRAFGAKASQIDWQIKAGAARPMILSGLRLGVSMSTVHVVLAEILGANQGLGFLAQQAANQFQIVQSYALVIMLVVVTSILLTVMERVLRSRQEV